jgi:D-alanine--poly(phosphoribitol) ligase subunit 1
MEHDITLKQIIYHLEEGGDSKAFFINETWYTYRELASLVAGIQDIIMADLGRTAHVGVFLSNDLHTYASILALWMSGKAFVPVNPQFPAARNRSVMDQMNLEVVLHSGGLDPDQLIPGCRSVDTGHLGLDTGLQPVLDTFDGGRDAYVLFTSGSTGKPKGVRISFFNLNAFLGDFMEYPAYSFIPEDRFLQIYDLSFDGSIPSWVVPLACGASVFTVPSGEIKYLAAYKLMQEHQLTFIKMPPSTLTFLRPYFPSIHLPAVKYCLLGGEALPGSLAKEFESCIPNALIQNVYGPTETAVISLIYDWNGDGNGRKEHLGIASVGKPIGSCKVMVLADDNQAAEPGVIGELIIAGNQVSPGYWNNRELNQRAFIDREVDGKSLRFYRTGDMVMMDQEGDLMFLGRNDEQVQVRGYRVELGEIESLAREFLGGKNVMAAGIASEAADMQLFLAIESAPMDPGPLRKHLEMHLPPYMVPGKVKFIQKFPRLVSGKLDRRAIQEQLAE